MRVPGPSKSSPRSPRRERQTGHLPRLPARTFKNSSLSKNSASGPLGRFILLFFIPPYATSQRQPRATGRRKTLRTLARQPQPQPQTQPVSSVLRAPLPPTLRRGQSARARRPASAHRRQDGRGDRRCHRAVGYAAPVRRRAALQLRQAGLGSLAPREVGLRLKSAGWRSLGLPPQPQFPLGKVYLQHSSRISSLILLQGLAQIQVGGRKNFGSSLLREHL